MKNLTEIDVRRFMDAVGPHNAVSVDDELCIADICGRSRSTRMNFPFRFDGLMLIWCIKGNLKVSADLAEYDLKDNMLFLCFPGRIFKLNEIIGDEDNIHYVCMAMSKEFASGHNLDVNRVFSNALSLFDDPSVHIGEAQATLMAEYMDMIRNVAKAEIRYRKECVQSLWDSMLYVIAGVLDQRNETVSQNSVHSPSSRSRVLFERFLALVAEHHDTHRNVGFYADKLCLTPKYLSKLIKTASGRSAPEWIDAYVILEAKNLLKYSDCAIKEIVYKLNFPNQSVFYKFFKARTGMTPSEYRRA